MVHSNIIRCIFECVSNRVNSIETRMNLLIPNCDNFKKLSVLAQTIKFPYQQCIFQTHFLSNVYSCLEYNSVSYNMVYTPCFEEVDLKGSLSRN